MVRLLWRFSLLLVAALFFAWLADRPGSVTINWLGREINMSVLVAVAIALALIFALSFAVATAASHLAQPHGGA